MPEFQTMPVRFRVWDSKSRRMWSEKDIYKGYDITDDPAIFGLCDMSAIWDKIGMDFVNLIFSPDTGLKDKNGKSIYTGDIVRLTKAEYNPIDKLEHIQKYELPVVCENGNTSLKIERPESHGGNYWILLSMQRPENLEIIGNIWQDGERLLCPKE